MIGALAALALAAAPAAPGAGELVKSLVDEAGPRMAGSDGDARAVAWALRQLKALGLANVHSEPVEIPRWERGEASAEIVAPGAHRLAVVALGGSVGTAPDGLEAEVVEVATLEALDALDPPLAKGRIVFLNQPMQRTRGFEGYRGAAPGRRRGPAAAEKLGAVGFLLRSVTASTDRFPHTGSMKPAAIPSAALAVPDAELLHRLGMGGAPVRVRLALGCKRLADGASANVVGEIRGRERPEEVVLLAAHLDSWDVSAGAADDGAGIGVVLAAAKALAGSTPAPKRTVRVVLFANEENGLSGANAYALAHKAELPSHRLALEMDHGSARVEAATVLAAADAGSALKELGAALRALGIKQVGRAENNGADLGPLRAAGVPVAMLEQDSTAYFDVHHSANDTLEKLDFVALDQVAAAVFVFARAAADGSAPLGRVPVELREEK